VIGKLSFSALGKSQPQPTAGGLIVDMVNNADKSKVFILLLIMKYELNIFGGEFRDEPTKRLSLPLLYVGLCLPTIVVVLLSME
jgi:hypothetical protein